MMSPIRSASNLLLYHKHTKQYHVTRGGKRIYLGVDRDEALEKYHRLAPGQQVALYEYGKSLIPKAQGYINAPTAKTILVALICFFLAPTYIIACANVGPT